VRLSVVLLLVSLAGVLGLGIVADSVAVGVYALLRDDGRGVQAPPVHQVPTLHDVLERARAS